MRQQARTKLFSTSVLGLMLLLTFVVVVINYDSSICPSPECFLRTDRPSILCRGSGCRKENCDVQADDDQPVAKSFTQSQNRSILVLCAISITI